MKTDKKIRKGCLVRLNPQKCFTAAQGGGLRYPLTNYANDEAGIVLSSRPTTPEDEKAWYKNQRREVEAAVNAGKDTWPITMNDAGESRLPPQSVGVTLYRDRVYTVLRARASVRLGWGKKTGGLTKILCTETGEETYIKRELVETVK